MTASTSKQSDTKTALITGASSGIGESLARFLAGRRWRVALTARRADRLQLLTQEIQAGGGQARAYPADLSSEDKCQHLYQQVSLDGRIDLLINNAGFGWYGYFANMPWETARQMLAVNVECMLHLTHLCLPEMLKRGSGHIINIGSIAGGFSNQGVALYSASKSFMDGFTSALHRELRGSGVHASVLRLGPVRTEFFQAARELENGSALPVERWGMPVERVNQALGRLLRRPRSVMYLPGWLWITQFIDPLLGRLIDRLGPHLLRRIAKQLPQSENYQ